MTLKYIPKSKQFFHSFFKIDLNILGRKKCYYNNYNLKRHLKNQNLRDFLGYQTTFNYKTIQMKFILMEECDVIISSIINLV